MEGIAESARSAALGLADAAEFAVSRALDRALVCPARLSTGLLAGSAASAGTFVVSAASIVETARGSSLPAADYAQASRGRASRRPVNRGYRAWNSA